MIVSSAAPSTLPQNLLQQSSAPPAKNAMNQLRAGENNVENGNRSQNNVGTEVSTPNRQQTTEISRSQLTGLSGSRLQQQAPEAVTTSNLREPDLIGPSGGRSDASSQSAGNQIETARNQQQLNQPNLGTTADNTPNDIQTAANPGSSTDAAQIANTAVDAYSRQTQLSSNIDQASPIIDVLA